jgi:hypothetical protein
MLFPKSSGKRLYSQKAADQKLDKAESEKVKVRSEGRCEVFELQQWSNSPLEVPLMVRCPYRAEHVMHLIGGRGKRGRGKSALAIHKLHGCAEHHREIDGDVGGRRLKRIGGPVPHWTDCYERVKARRQSGAA